MPQSSPFVDLSISFSSNPFNSDLMVTKNATAIQRSLYDLILTKPGERFFNPNVGCGVSGLLFEPLNFVTAGTIKNQIEYTVNAFEPRVILQNVDVEIDDNNNAFNVILSYIIVGQPNTTQQTTLILNSTRS
jgi:phage baseplate assembly protein W